MTVELSEDQLDGLKELTNIGIGRAAGILNSMLSTHIELSVPMVKKISLHHLKDSMKELGTGSLSIVELGFHGDFGGSASLIFPPDSARKLVSVAIGEEEVSPTLSAIHVETLNEIGNIILNGVMGSFSNIMFSELKYSLPNYSEMPPEELSHKIEQNKNVVILLIQTKFIANDINVEGHVLLLFEISSFKALTDAIDSLLCEV